VKLIHRMIPNYICLISNKLSHSNPFIEFEGEHITHNQNFTLSNEFIYQI